MIPLDPAAGDPEDRRRYFGPRYSRGGAAQLGRSPGAAEIWKSVTAHITLIPSFYSDILDRVFAFITYEM